MADKTNSASGNSCTACASRCSNGYERAVVAVQRKLNGAMGSLGALVARRPVLVIVLSILATAAAAAGWARFQIENDTDKLWVPQHSQAMKDRDWVTANYATGGGGAQVLGSLLPGRQSQYANNALQLPVFWELFQVDAAVRAINVSYGGRTYRWTDVCDVDFDGNCKYGGPLNLWSMNFTAYLADVNGSTTDPTAGNRNTLIQDVNQQRFPDGTSISTLSIFGGIVLSPLPNPPPDQPPFFLSAAQVVALGYSLRDGLGDVEDKWYDAFLDELEAWQSRTSYTALAYIASSSVGLEIGRSVTNDLYLIVISVAIFVVVAVLGLSRMDMVGTRSSLALLGVVSAVLAMVAGYGLSLLFNCPFNTLSQTLPYVLLGLSVDCMFILVKSYDGIVAMTATTGAAASLESRFRALQSSAGSSVVVTLLASAVAFALGAISELPAVQWFSVYATMGVLCILVATLTFFTGVFVLTERRIARNRLDCCCCATSGAPHQPTAATHYLDNSEGGSNCCCGGGGGRGSESNGGGSGGKQSAVDGGPVLRAVVVEPASWQVPPAPLAAPSRGGGGAVAESVEEAAPPGTVRTPTAGQQQPQGQQGSGQATLSPAPLAAAKQQQQVSSLDTGTYLPQLPSSEPHAAAAAPGVVPEHNLIKTLFARYYAPLLTRWWFKVAVLAVFIGWAVLSGVGIPRLKAGQPLSELAPDDSYLQAYVTITSDTFDQQIGAPASIYFRWVDPSSPQQQAKMLNALGAALGNRFVNSTVSAFQGNWLIDFIEWVQAEQPAVALVPLPGCTNPFQGRVSGDLGAFVRPSTINGCVPQSQFYALLKEFLATHRGYLDDLLWTQPAGSGGGQPTPTTPTTVWSCRLPVVHTAPGDDGAYGRELIRSIGSLTDAVNGGIFAADNAGAPDEVFFMYNSDYIYNEGDAILGKMTMEYVLLAVAGVGVVLMLTLPSLRAVVLMMVAVGLVDYFLFGQMFILDIRFNQVSIINMIMATGLSVDYAVYFAQRFVAVTADGTRNGRMAMAMADTGSAVFLGGLTALTGTIPLAFATSTILRIFFSLIFGTICFALLVGLMLMPVVFSLVGPPPLRQHPELTTAGGSSADTTTTALPPPSPSGKGDRAGGGSGSP